MKDNYLPSLYFLYKGDKLENQNYCVYMHVNKQNGKKYIGITRQKPYKRWSNGRGYKSNKHFFHAIQKYGWDGFEHIIIINHIDAETASLVEQQLIELYQSNNQLYGYNICSGGQTNILPKESYRKGGETRKGRSIPVEQIQRMLQTKKDRGYFTSVECDNKKYSSIKECAEYYNIDPKQMQRWLSGERYIPEEFVRLNLHLTGVETVYETHPQKRYVIKYQNHCYASAWEFAKSQNLSKYTVSDWLSNKKRIPKHYIDNGLEIKQKIAYKIKTKENKNYG